MRNYFKYEVKKSLPQFLILFVLFFVIYVIPTATTNFGNWWQYQDNEAEFGLEILSFGLIASCLIVPIFKFEYKMKKRSVDLFYSLPISRTKVFAVNFIVGFLEIIAAFTVAYAIGVVISIFRIENIYPWWYLVLYFASIIPCFMIYSFVTFFFIKGNTTIDGILFVLMALISLAVFVSFIAGNFTSDIYGYGSNFFVFTPLVKIVGALQNKVGWDTNAKPLFNFNVDQMIVYIMDDSVEGYHEAIVADYSNVKESVCLIVSSILFVAISIACTISMFKTEKNVKAENCVQISESWFGYKTFIPFYAFMAIENAALYFEELSIILLAVYTFIFYLANVVYKRSFKIGKKQVIIIAVVTVVAVIFGFVMSILK